MNGPVLHMAIDIGIELPAGQNAIKTGSVGGRQVLLIDVRAEGNELHRGESLLQGFSRGRDVRNRDRGEVDDAGGNLLGGQLIEPHRGSIGYGHHRTVLLFSRGLEQWDEE